MISLPLHPRKFVNVNHFSQIIFEFDFYRDVRVRHARNRRAFTGESTAARTREYGCDSLD